MSFLQQPRKHPHRRPHRHPPQQRWIPLPTQRRLCPALSTACTARVTGIWIQLSAIFWMLMTILLTPVKFGQSRSDGCDDVCLNGRHLPARLRSDSIWTEWLNKADLVKWGIQLVSDSCTHAVYLWQAWKTTAVTEPHILSQPEPMVPAPEPLVEPMLPVPEPLVWSRP
jgi:hypothetical protein